MTIDWTKPVETDEDNPRPVRVLCTDNKDHGYPVVVLIAGMVLQYTLDGKHVLGATSPKLCLRNTPPQVVKHVGYISLTKPRNRPACYPWVCPEAEIYNTPEEAKKERLPDKSWERIAVVKVEWEELVEVSTPPTL